MSIEGYKLYSKIFDTEHYLINEEGDIYMDCDCDDPMIGDTFLKREDKIVVMGGNGYITATFEKADIEKVHASLLKDIDRYKLIVNAEESEDNFLCQDYEGKIYVKGNVVIVVGNYMEYRTYTSHEGKINADSKIRLEHDYVVLWTEDFRCIIEPYFEYQYMDAIRKANKILNVLESFVSEVVLM